MDKKKVEELIEQAIIWSRYANQHSVISNLEEALKELNKPDWVSVKDRLPPVDKEAVVLTTDGEICFGHIVDKKIVKDYNGWNIPDVEYWLPFVDPKDK